MAKRGITVSKAFADVVDVGEKTVRYWLHDPPSDPKDENVEKVALWYGKPVEKIYEMWTIFMVQLNKPYQSDDELVSEVGEAAGVYGQPDILAEAKDLEKLDLRNVPPELALTLHEERAELIRFIEVTMAELWSRIKRYRKHYKNAVALAIRTRLPQG